MFIKNYIITGEIECVTGLHIGEALDTIDIGGSDNPLIRKSTNNLPYIPGSSLKGKLRSLLELADKKSSRSIINNKGRVSTEGIGAELFGISADSGDVIKDGISYKVIVRDSFPTKDTEKNWEDNKELYNGSELKYENSLNRLTAEAKPRNIERVPPESKFNFEIIIKISSKNEEYDSKKTDVLPLLRSMKLLEDDYLGGSGSRGFGKIKFINLKLTERNLDYYLDDDDENIILNDISSISELITKVHE